MAQPPKIEPITPNLPNPRALSFLSAAVHSAVPEATVEFLRPDALIVTLRGRQFAIPLARSRLDDLERAIDGGLGMPYLNGLKRDAEFDLYRVLGNEGLLTQKFRLSIARQSTWQGRVKHDGKGSRGVWIMPLMIVAGKRYVEG